MPSTEADQLAKKRADEDVHKLAADATKYATDVMRIANKLGTEEAMNAAIHAAWHSELANRDATNVAGNRYRNFVCNVTMETSRAHDILEALRTKSYVMKPANDNMKIYALKISAKVDEEDAIAANIHVDYSVALATSISAVANAVARATSISAVANAVARARFLSGPLKLVLVIVSRHAWNDAISVVSSNRAVVAAHRAVMSSQLVLNAFPTSNFIVAANIRALKIAIQRAAAADKDAVKNTSKCKAALVASYGIPATTP